MSFNWLSDEVHLGLGESEKSRRKKKKRPAASHWTGLDGLENSVFLHELWFWLVFWSFWRTMTGDDFCLLFRSNESPNH